MKTPLFLSAVCLAAAFQALAAPSRLPRIQAEMRGRHFEKAVTLADEAIAAQEPDADQALLLKAVALFHGKRYEDAVSAADRLLEDFPKSAWRHKARLLKAQSLIERKQFQQAALIYEEESARLLSAERKQALVGEILRFAEKLEAKPDPNVPDAPAPDFAKAHSLYTKALMMELPRDFRDHVIFRKARAIQQAGNPAQAVQDFQAYLTEYDPLWVGPAGSGTPRLPMQNPPPAGAHVAMARFRLAEALLQSGDSASARMELDDLLKMVGGPLKETSALAAELATEDGKRLPAEIRWLKVRTYVGPSAGAGGAVAVQSPIPRGAGSAATLSFSLVAGDPDQAVQACRDYLTKHPVGARSITAAWMMAEVLQGIGRADDAIGAYREFIVGKGFALPEGEAATKVDDEIQATPAIYLETLKMRAVFRIGRILAEQKKHEEAIVVWQGYVKDFPNGPEWSEAQESIINSEFQMGMDALVAKQDELAMRRFEEFLRAHPLDGRAPRILYLFGAMHEAAALEAEEAKRGKQEVEQEYRKAADEWVKLVSKYPESPEARAAQMRTGYIYEEKLGQFEKALNIYQKLVAGGAEPTASAAVARLSGKALEASAEKVFRTNEKPVVHLKLRNIEKCEVRIYKIDLQAYFRKMHAIIGVEALDVSLIQPDRTWTFKPEGYAKYRPLEQDVEIPFNGEEAGAYVVTVADDEWESTVLVLRSDLEVVVKSSRREVLAFIQDMRTGRPADGVDLLVSSGTEVAATGKTGKDGVFKCKLESLKDLNDVRVFALRSGHASAFNLPLAGLQLSTGLTAKGYLYTDRPVYLPGEMVSMRGILRDVGNGEYRIPEDASFLIRFSDPQARLLSEQKVKLSGFGTFAARFQLPEMAAIGQYTMTASQEKAGRSPLVFQGVFDVREFKLEKIKLAMEFQRRVWFRGEKIEATLNAGYYWGEPLANRVLRCTLPDRRIERIATDNEGRAKLVFDTTGMSPGTQLVFTASLDGENVSLTESVTLARLGFSIGAVPSQPVVIAGEPFDLKLSTRGADGKPVGENLVVSVLRMEKPKTSRIRALLPWPQEPELPSAEVKESEVTASTDAITGDARVSLTLGKGGVYRLRVSGSDRFNQPILTEALIEVSADDDINKLRLFADEANLKVGQESRVRLHSRMDGGLALVTYEGETILRHQIVELHKEYNDIIFPVGHDLFPNFRLAVAAIDGRELRHAVKDFTVERELKVALKPVGGFFLPGEEGKVEITATDSMGKPVEAELSLALVNEALFAVHPDTTPPILEFFQKEARRYADFHTGATCGFRYAGITRPVSKALIDESQRLVRAVEEKKAMMAARVALQSSVLRGAMDADRRESGGQDRKLDEIVNEVTSGASNKPEPSTPVVKEAEGAGRPADAPSPAVRREVRGEGRWLPSVITGKDGKALALIPMPETTTAWRLTARGCSVETLVGQATVGMLTRKDFFVELKMPSFLREGDGLRVVGRVHNLTDFSGKVPLKLRVLDARDPAKVLATREAEVELKAKGGGEVAFDSFVVPDHLNVMFELSGAAGGLSDSLVQSLPVQPWGLPYAVHEGGVAEADTAVSLQLPEGREYKSLWMAVSVGPDIKDSVLEMALQSGGPGAEYFRIMPPAWDGHPGDDLLAVAAALGYANQGQADRELPLRLAERGRALVATLVSSQAADGSWNSEVVGGYTTARTFWALIEARNAGLAVHKDTLDKAAAFLLKQLEGFEANDSASKAIVLHALSTDKRADFAVCNRLYRERNQLGSATLAYLTRAFFNMDRKEIAAELAGILEEKAKVEPGLPVFWEPGYQVAWLNDVPETTALVLLALSESKTTSGRVAAAVEALLKSHGCFGFPTGRAKGPAVAALAAWFGRGKEQQTDMEIAVQVNGKEIGTVKAAGAQASHVIEVPADAIQAGKKNLVEFKMHGRGRYAFGVTLTGFSPDTKSTGDGVIPRMNVWDFVHTPLEYRGMPIAAGSTSKVQNMENGQRVNVRVIDATGHYVGPRWFTLDIPLPAGARLVEGSLSVSDGLKAEVHPTSIQVIFIEHCPSVSFDLTGYAPGKFRMLPAVIREIGDPGFMSVGPAPEITVLAAGEKSPDPYVMNISERFALGQCYFNDGEDGKALEYLDAVFKENRKHNESELARMLLWIHTKPGFYDARKIVEMFEILRERFPTLEIPFDRILVVGKAYRDIGEHERAWLVYRAVISASFTNDAGISAVLEDEGRFLGSIDYQERVWREYPDTAEVVSAYFAISQLLYEKAPKAHELPKEDAVQPEKVAMLKRTVEMLASFLALYPMDPLADDAGFSLCNGMLDLKDYPRVVEFSQEFAKRHADSELAPGFQYMTALGLFWQNQYVQALQAARVVADGESKDRDFARYILGQIYHAQSKPADAIQWYEKVKGLYPDAAEAISYFEKKNIRLEEVTVVKPSDPVSLTLKYRNIKEAFVQVYRVDLMKLYLQQKNLSAITSVQLAGIKPEHEQTIVLGDGKDYVEKERSIPLGLKDEAAYLVICRGDDLFASGMVLITPLKIEAQEDAVSGRVRANVLDVASGGYRPEVHVKAIGSADIEFRSGETDLRGLFIADNLRGKATVIAREGASRYAFFRGETWLGAPENTPPPAPPAKPEAGQMLNYQDNLMLRNSDIQMNINGSWNQQRRQTQNKGVQIQKAY